MTFAEARLVLRNDVLAEASTEYYSDDDLFGYLKRSAKELALTFGFPTALSSVSVSAGDWSFALPNDAAQVDLNEVSYSGFAMRSASYARVLHAKDQSSLGLPRIYNWESKRGGVVYFAPKAPAAGTIQFEYVVDYDTELLTTSDDIWGTLFPAYHELVVYRAAVKAFDASLEFDKSQYWRQREQAMMQEFSAFLGKRSLETLVIPEANG